MKYLIFFTILLLTGCSNTNNIYANARTDSPAQWVVKIEPKYPVDAAAKGIEGYVKFNAVVNKHGILENIEVVESSPKRVFESEGLRALKFWRFKPAKLNGRVVKALYQDTIVWELKKTNITPK